MAPAPARSFCERCGEGHVLQQETRRRLPGLALPVVTKGLRNFVTSDDTLRAAMTQARIEDDDVRSSRLDEAFRRTFRFCLNCRQYVCHECWNAEAARCATCAPLGASVGGPTVADEPFPPETEAVMPTAVPAAAVVEPAATSMSSVSPEPDLALVERRSEIEHTIVVPPTPPLVQFVRLPSAPVVEEPHDVGPEPIAPEPEPEPEPEPVAAVATRPPDAPAPNPWPMMETVVEVPRSAVHAATSPAAVSPAPSGPGQMTCQACALRLSRAARFCRRCGTPQSTQLSA
jgi:hypothetical protein